jgi:hypothetical protein
MPLCPQITITPITVTSTGMTQTSVIDAGVPATTAQANTALADAQAALAQANVALAEANDAYTAAIGSLQPSANTIVNSTNQITAINGTGITVYSGASATSGARVVLNSAGLAGFDTGGTATFSISASTGAAVFSGAVTGSTITGGTLNIAGNAIINSSGFLTATGATITGAITATSGSFTGSIFSTSGLIGGFTITSTYIGNASATFYINSSNGNAQFNNLFINAASGTSGITLSNGGNISMNGGALNMATGNINSAGTVAASTITSSGTITATGNIVANGDVNLASTSDLRVPYAHSTTTANAATVWISSTGQFRRSTASSQRYKTDIVNLTDVPELDPKALYDLPVRAFRFKDGYLPETDDRFGVLVPGFIAEEMDAIYPAATDYADGVETWNDRMIIPAMLALIQDQQARIKVLEGE